MKSENYKLELEELSQCDKCLNENICLYKEMNKDQDCLQFDDVLDSIKGKNDKAKNNSNNIKKGSKNMTMTTMSNLITKRAIKMAEATGLVMDPKDDGLKEWLKDNVLTSSEIAQSEGISRGAISQRIKKGKLKPLKKTPNGYIFLKSEVENKELPFELLINTREKNIIREFLLKNKKILITGEIASGKTYLIDYLKSSTKDIRTDIEFYDDIYDCDNCVVKSSFDKDNQAVAITVQSSCSDLGPLGEVINTIIVERAISHVSRIMEVDENYTYKKLDYVIVCDNDYKVYIVKNKD